MGSASGMRGSGVSRFSSLIDRLLIESRTRSAGRRGSHTINTMRGKSIRRTPTGDCLPGAGPCREGVDEARQTRLVSRRRVLVQDSLLDGAVDEGHGLREEPACFLEILAGHGRAQL